MHELLLFGQVPEARHNQLLHILAGLSAMQPRVSKEYHVLFRPTSLPTSTVTKTGGTQGVTSVKTGAAAAAAAKAQREKNENVFFVKLVRDIKEGEDEEQREGEWRFVFQETPVASNKHVILRTAQETLITSGDAIAYVEALGYTYHSSTVQTSHTFILENTILTLSRTHLFRNPSHSEIIPPLANLPLLDKSGTYILEAKIRVAEDKPENTPSLLTRAEGELLDFAKRMRGIVDMYMPDRLSLDTVYKSVRPRLKVTGGSGSQAGRAAGVAR